ncbi:MAG TPA: hypothetical protein VIL85_10920 [Thermomicrobiales bacterium]|jgi:hypothetical protein
MSGPYGIGGYDGPSERLTRDTGGVEMRAPDGVPFNRPADERVTRAAFASADDPAARRRLPWFALGLMLVIVLIVVIKAPITATFLAVAFGIIGGLIAWLRSMD